MSRLITKCPACNADLKIAAMQCPECEMELRGEFELSAFDRLSQEQRDFLMSFLRRRGNLSGVQSELHISYPTAKKRLDDVLVALGVEGGYTSDQYREAIDMTTWNIDENSKKASDIIRAKLRENGGRVIVHTARGLPCEIVASSDGQSFSSDKLPIKPPYRFEVFDVIVDLLRSHNGRARKGNGRNYRLGEPECDETTVVGAIAYHYAGKKDGDSVYDPVFVLAAVLEWAEIAVNDRGWIILM